MITSKSPLCFETLDWKRLILLWRRLLSPWYFVPVCLKWCWAFMSFLTLLMFNTRIKAFTEGPLCSSSSIPEVANSWTMSVGLSLCQCFFSQPEQSYTNVPTCPIQLWKYHVGFIVLLSITTSKWHKVSPLRERERERCVTNIFNLDG